MAWKTSSVMDEKIRFVVGYEQDQLSMRELCARFEISRETGYVWLRRYRQYGLKGLVELNRAPRHHPNQTGAAVEAAVLELRQAHMRWDRHCFGCKGPGPRDRLRGSVGLLRRLMF
jgi:putative transposase